MKLSSILIVTLVASSALADDPPNDPGDLIREVQNLRLEIRQLRKEIEELRQPAPPDKTSLRAGDGIGRRHNKLQNEPAERYKPLTKTQRDELVRRLHLMDPQAARDYFRHQPTVKEAHAQWSRRADDARRRQQQEDHWRIRNNAEWRPTRGRLDPRYLPRDWRRFRN